MGSSNSIHASEREQIPPKLRNTVWTIYHGRKTHGICYCCGIRVERYNSGWHCSHVLSQAKGGKNEVDNLRVCCTHCNTSMGDQNLYTYIKDNILHKSLYGPWNY